MSSQGRRSCILAVDDDPGILRAISRILGQRHAVTCVASGPAALEMVGPLFPDVAIIDIRMPEMDGFELMRRLKAIRPDLDVILMTGNSEEPDANLVQAIDAGAFYFIQKPFERAVLLVLVARCLELRRLREERQQYLELLETELDQARHFQMSLLPPWEADLHGIALAARYVACNQLAGDFYDYADAGDGAVALLVADVAGHGASAAMMTLIVKSAFHSAGDDGFAPLSVVERVREGIRALDADRFITLCCARLEPGAGRLSYANAGHPPPILCRSPSEHVLLKPTGPLLSSALDEIPCGYADVPLGQGNVLLLYTDGVTDTRGPNGAFGRQRIVSLLADEGLRGPRLLDQILAEATEFSGGRLIEDDITLLVAEFLG